MPETSVLIPQLYYSSLVENYFSLSNQATRGRSGPRSSVVSDIQPLFFLTARLIVSPNSSDFSEGDVVTVICEEDQSFSDWTVRRNTSKLQRAECGDGRGQQQRDQSCSISMLVPHDTGVYWCESSNGAISNLVNITVTGKLITLTLLLIASTN